MMGGPSGNQPSVMRHDFSKTPAVGIQRSKFDRSHGYKTTFDAGPLIPVYVDEVLPGDTFNLRMSAFARLATPLKPIMDNLFLETFFFFVPNRLVWDNWEKFNGAEDDPGDSNAFIIPVVNEPNSGGFVAGGLGDYFGMPVGYSSGTAALKVLPSALPFRAYNLIYNDWFRDENLIDSANMDTGDGGGDVTRYPVRLRGKRHDYFTSCLPWPQKGPAVSLPLGSTAPITRVSNATAWDAYNTGTDTLASAGDLVIDAGGALESTTGPVDVSLDPDGGLIADLSGATAATINALREAEQLQVFYERDARGGTRYIEIIKSHFGVTSPDARLQRPEYLGGGSTPINVHPVPQTGEAGSTAQGNLAAFGTASFSGHGFNKSFVEHGYIIGLVNVRADLTYQQGLDRMWSRSTRVDFYWPSFAHLGEQAVLNKEIFLRADANDALVFGYQERYAEYRYKPSQITGHFRSEFATTLDAWHLSQEFTVVPTLGETFINEAPPIDRVIAVPTEPHFLFDAYFNLICARPMPVYGIPTLGNRL